MMIYGSMMEMVNRDHGRKNLKKGLSLPSVVEDFELLET